MNVKLSDLSLVGWMVTLVTVALVVVLMLFSGTLYTSILPAGRYPTMLLIAPGLILGIAFFAISAMILNRMGLPIVRRRGQNTAPTQGA
jgi:hypothetical protein